MLLVAEYDDLGIDLVNAPNGGAPIDVILHGSAPPQGRAWRPARYYGDLGEMQIHRIPVPGGQDQRHAFVIFRAENTKKLVEPVR
jgi:hypothetical protein